ncbi:MAG TPA: TlyA family RNA methyltransferase [Candidatus Acidoferrales bacterium]|nr:TlyA family RNA methyltransferase [Candidatus Acidoferrales bacterium]
MAHKPDRERLDVLLVERGLAASRQKAQAMILAGEVQADGARVEKAGQLVASNARLEVHSRLQKYASRAGLKLEGALEDFGISPVGRVCLDVGSSTGGFTDCLLQHGAARVYAVDVTVNQLAWKLQQDPRVVRLERNARELSPADLPEAVDLVVMDVSFISATKVIGPASSVARPGADVVVLVKPQFELRREQVGSGGIVREAKLHEEAVARVREAVESAGIRVLGVRPSRLPGAEGNQEFFLHARRAALE